MLSALLIMASRTASMLVLAGWVGACAFATGCALPKECMYHGTCSKTGYARTETHRDGPVEHYDLPPPKPRRFTLAQSAAAPTPPPAAPCAPDRIGLDGNVGGSTVLHACADHVTMECWKGPDGERVCTAKAVIAAPKGEFDRETARYVLASVPYRECGGDTGKIHVTFQPSGYSSAASVVEGDYDDNVRQCIAHKFLGLRIPPFGGDARTIAWRLDPAS